jgi:hypothetical protein
MAKEQHLRNADESCRLAAFDRQNVVAALMQLGPPNRRNPPESMGKPALSLLSIPGATGCPA